MTAVAEPAEVSVVIPAFNEQEAIADVVSRVRGRGAWREVLVVSEQMNLEQLAASEVGPADSPLDAAVGDRLPDP